MDGPLIVYQNRDMRPLVLDFAHRVLELRNSWPTRGIQNPDPPSTPNSLKSAQKLLKNSILRVFLVFGEFFQGISGQGPGVTFEIFQGASGLGVLDPCSWPGVSPSWSSSRSCMPMKLMESKALLFSLQVRVLSMGPRPGPKLVLKTSQRARSTGPKATP